MEKKVMGWKTKGMNRDLSVSAFNTEFSFENINLRLSTNEGNTLMSWVNEIGPKKLFLQIEGVAETDEEKAYIQGTPIGTAVLNNQLVVFTHREPQEYVNYTDFIYMFTVDDVATGTLKGKMLYKGNLNFNTNYPLETLVSYEANDIQKVYWTDGYNQPRLINIAASEDNVSSWNDTSFDFITTLKLKEFIAVEKVIGAEGMFTPGVIQYAFTYYNKYGQESSIFYTSPLHYISYLDRGAAPSTTTVSNAFKISITNVDTNFDYLRIYSVHRTSLDATPEVKQLTDIPLKNLKEYKKFKTSIVYEDAESYNLPIDIQYGNQKILTATTENGDYTVWIDLDGIPVFKNTADVKVVAWYKDGDTTSYEELMSFQDFIEGCMDSTKFDKETGGQISVYCKNDKDNFYSYIYVEQDLDRYMQSLAEEVYHDRGKWGLLVDGELVTGDAAQYMYEQYIIYNYGDQKWYVLSTDNIQDTVDVTINKGETQYADTITYMDTGTTGSSLDPTELLYKGGENIVVQTMEQKDNTLFLGNINIQRQYIESTLQKDVAEDLKKARKIESTYRTMTLSKDYSSNVEEVTYKYSNQLTGYTTVTNPYVAPTINSNTNKSVPCGGFKKGDYYRLGVQFQYKSGKWSNPIYINDITQANRFSIGETTLSTGYKREVVSIPIFKGNLSDIVVNKALKAGYKKVRAVAVFPSIQDKMCLLQGVVCPTLYTKEHRETDKDLYAQSSWYFRFIRPADTKDMNDEGAVYPVSEDLVYIGVDKDTYDAVTTPNPSNMRLVEIQGSYKDDVKFKTDRTFVTLHSPEIEFEDQYRNIDYTGFDFQQVGFATVTTTLSDIDIQTETPTVSSNGGGFIHKAFNGKNSFGINTGLFYEDYTIDDLGDDQPYAATDDQRSPYKWFVYPWHQSTSLNNDIRRPSNKGVQSATLKKKVISNLRYTTSSWSEYNAIKNVTAQIWASEENTIIKLNNDIYRGNIDTLLVPDYADGTYFCFDNTESSTAQNVQTKFTSSNYWKTFSKEASQQNGEGVYAWVNNTWVRRNAEIGDKNLSLVRKKENVRMKYKSTPHLVVAKSFEFVRPNALPIVEVRRADTEEVKATLFGGKTEDALMANTWIPCGEPVALDADHDVDFYWEYGDTYYQRWDCLKTYPYTTGDINQIVEIGSFMLETKINIDGRYDRNRGQASNINMSPTNFNLYNPVYSQTDNFFNYRIVDEATYKHTTFPNQITWTKTKQSGADVDLWTNLTLANTLDLDGDKGGISKLIRQNDAIIAFQDKGIAQILYNDNVQVASTSGVPIEIANSQKVSGKRYMADTVGCSNKWSIVSTPQGNYFIDSNNKDIYLLGQQLSNISAPQGFSSWCKQTIPSNGEIWNPINTNNFVAYYDHTTQDVYFIYKDICLAYSEKTNSFSSFYDYNAPYFCGVQDIGLWIGKDNSKEGNQYYLYQHRAGEYCNFFGVSKPFSLTLVGNAESQLDKTFTNLEFRAMVNGEGETGAKEKYSAYLPFDKLEVWNEYQHGLSTLKDALSMKHHLFKEEASTLKRKFRMWRCDIPRDNAPIPETKEGVFRTKAHPMNRMRNPWVYLKLENNNTSNKKVEIHDIVMMYLA